MALGYVLDDLFARHRPPGPHPERPERVLAARDALREAGLDRMGEAVGVRPAREEELLIEPGLALDRLGRIVEIPRSACIRLGRWFDQQADDLLERGLFRGAEAVVVDGSPVPGVVADLFVRFLACERGKTPAFAAGPFDALDAVVPSRLRDGYEPRLFVRQERPLPLPAPDVLWPTARAGLPSLVVVAEDQIPADYWVPQPPKLDRQSLLAALKRGGEVAGAQLGNPKPTLAVRTK